MATSLDELNALLDNFVPLTKKVSVAKDLVLQKEAAALEKILLRFFLVMPYLHENGEPDQCPLINRTERVPTGQDSGFSVTNKLTLIEDGPRLVRSFTVEHWGASNPCVEVNDTQEISCLDAIKTYGFEDKCPIDVEYKALENRIEKADSLLEVLSEKFRIECRATEEALQ